MVGSEPDKIEVKAHKLILTMASPVFHEMFYGKQWENNECLIPIPDVHPEVFKTLLKYIYTSSIDINSFDMAWKLWHGGKIYKLPHLVIECNSYICSVVNPSNVCQSYECAHYFEENSIMEKCIQVISTKTKEVLNDKSFVDIELDTLITVLSLDDLNVDSEVELIDAVYMYVEAEKKKQKQISPADNEPPSEKLSLLRLEPLSDKKVLLNGESSSQTSPATEPDSEPAMEVVTSKPTAEEEGQRPAPAGIRAAIEKIRFLTLTSIEFAESRARSLLTVDEAYAVIMNITISDSVPMPTGFSESRKRRQHILVEETSNAATQFITPVEIVQGLASSDLITLKAAALAAREMLSMGSPMGSPTATPLASAELIEAGVIPLLVAALVQLCSDLQIDAACSLAYIASGTREHTCAVVYGGAIPKLIGLFRHGGEVAAQAAAALGTIAERGPDNRDSVLKLGALPAMLPYMDPETPPEQLRTYVWAYRNMCWHDNPLVSFELVSSALPQITELLALKDQELLGDACLALVSLTDGPNERIESIQAIPGLMKRLIDLMGHPALQVQKPALRVIGNMLTGTEEQINRCIEADPEASCLDHIINFLKCKDASLVKEAAWAASNILAGTQQQIQRALDKQILEPLIKVLAEGNATCQEEAVWAITNLCRGGSGEQLDLLLSTGFLEPYCGLLSTPDHPAVLTVLQGLNELLKDVNLKKILKQRITLKIKKIGVPELLKTLQKHEDLKIHLEASHLVRWIQITS